MITAINLSLNLGLEVVDLHVTVNLEI